MAVVLALITSGLWGTSDFFGGLATRREPVFRVMLWVHAIGLLGVLALAPVLAERIIGRDLAIGVVAGVIGLVGLLLLYWALSIGPMSVIAPLSAVMSAVVPVLWGFRSDDDSLSGTTLIGLLLGLVAVVAVSWQSGTPGSAGTSTASITPQAVGASIAAGVCFGTIILLYDATDEASAPWPIVSGRLVTTALLVAFALRRRQPLTPGTTLGFAAVAGIGDTLANVTLLLATSSAVGSTELSVVAVVAAFYPAATVIWARFALQEPLGRIRLAGLALGFGAIALMTLG